MEEHAIEKALEVWTLQNLVSLSLVLGMLSLGLALAKTYYKERERDLTLRVSIEIWRLATRVMPDLLLAMVVVFGVLVLNPDVMADIKVALPFTPLATVVFAAALIVRVFHGGSGSNKAAEKASLWLLLAANVVGLAGYTFVMEAPSSEYLEIHPSTFWTMVKSHFRSNASPHGLELAQACFYIFFSILMLELVWAFVAGTRRKSVSDEKASS